MKSIIQALKERGFIQQCTNETAIEKAATTEKIAFYAGFDPTADSLHVGSLVPIMAMVHLQKAGHIPIAIIGGGTAMVGDPSGKTEMRKILKREEIKTNGVKILTQLKRYLNLDGENGIFVDNAEWLLDLKYIEFLRDIGRHFKVNEMIKMEAYKQRLEREEGLSFIEFNYQLLQAYDFLVLFDRYKCILQAGGDDQWGNILAGTDLVRKLRNESVYGLTFPLLTTARGQKMGKTEKGTIWLDANKTSPYEFYQYWINTDDRDVIRFLLFFTFLPLEEIDQMEKLKNEELRQAKETLAFEATKITHGEEEAQRAKSASKAAFAKSGDDLSAMSTTKIPHVRLTAGILVADLFCETGLTPTKTAARRLIEQGGAYINDEKIVSVNTRITDEVLKNNSLILRCGKKKYHRIIAE